MDEREAYIALNMMEKVGPVTVRSLVAALGSARATFAADRDSLMRADGVGREVAEAILSQRERLDWQGEMARVAERGLRLITPLDEDYPRPLREIHDPPLALYVRGTLRATDRHAVAVVGTRHPTHYGRDVAEQLAYGLAKAGFAVVSGLAEGIDTMAHHGALKAHGRTLAVLGGGLERIYPVSNTELAAQIAEQGAVLSEFPLERQPDKTSFPIRNRIVSGLAMGVVVVEAGLKSGAMITTRLALEQGRSVFAVPGRIDSFAAQGCHALIRDGAALVTGVDDILSEFELLLPARPKAGGDRAAPRRADLSREEESIVALLSDGEKDVDSLIRESALKAGDVSSLLISLEMKRVIRMLPGRRVALAGGVAVQGGEDGQETGHR
jgi:DNA processing protein